VPERGEKAREAPIAAFLDGSTFTIRKKRRPSICVLESPPDRENLPHFTLSGRGGEEAYGIKRSLLLMNVQIPEEKKEKGGGVNGRCVEVGRQEKKVHLCLSGKGEEITFSFTTEEESAPLPYHRGETLISSIRGEKKKRGEPAMEVMLSIVRGEPGKKEQWRRRYRKRCYVLSYEKEETSQLQMLSEGRPANREPLHPGALLAQETAIPSRS